MINCPTSVCFYSHGAHTVWMTALMAESAWHVVACGLWLYIYYSLSLESLELLLSFSLGAPYVLLPFVTTCCHCTLSLDAVTHTCTFNVRLNTDSCFFFSPGCGCVPSPCLLQCVPSSCCPSPFYPMRCCSLSPTATTCSGSMDHSFMVITNVLTRVTQSRGAVDYRECHYVCKHSLRCNEYRCEQASRSILHRGLCPNRDGELLWMDKLWPSLCHVLFQRKYFCSRQLSNCVWICVFKVESKLYILSLPFRIYIYSFISQFKKVFFHIHVFLSKAFSYTLMMVLLNNSLWSVMVLLLCFSPNWTKSMSELHLENLCFSHFRLVELSFPFLKFVPGLPHAFRLLLHRVRGVCRIQKGTAIEQTIYDNVCIWTCW